MCHTLYLFTASDTKTVVVPSMIFALLSALSLSLLLPNQNLPRPTEILSRSPAMLLYVWLNLLHICLSNQRKASSVEEDSLNKPWRPIPAGRISAKSASRLLCASYVFTAAVCTFLGAPIQFVSLVVLGYLYNELGGSEDLVGKNIFNGLAIPQFGVGALQVAINRSLVLDWDVLTASLSLEGVGWSALSLLWRWVAVLTVVISTTIHVQDLADMAGDSARGRSTIPLILGEGCARWSVAVAMAGWSVILPYLWGVPLLWFLPVVVIGFATAVSVLVYRTVAADEMSLRMWCLWIVTTYTLPFIRALSAEDSDLPFFMAA